ncbi:MAG: tRNA (N6-isopentenyl adenosine(37)-C2)-methylthiotransferase MiaB [Luteitalea sp.]|nr:tRNA (N6-isopentenyl adenosine(37)-C2)-methylthiotransferase MiaB [Luteitalea sp.]
MPQKYLIETYGCQMNVHDSERMAGLLEQAGFEAVTDPVDADIIVVNTCSVREHAEDKLYSRLGELRQVGLQRGSQPVVAVTGCVAQQLGDELFRRSSLVDVVVGTQSLKQLPGLVAQKLSAADGPADISLVDVSPHDDVSFPLGIARRRDSLKAYVNIIEGCNDCCAFCIVPYTRGRERMRALSEILAEVREAAENGHSEVHLLGQIVNHYQAPDDPGCDFAALLERVHEVPGIQRIRFASPHPRHVSHRLIHALRDLPKVCKHLHLPVQSGSTPVLARMRRRYTRERYLDLVAELRSEVEGIQLSTDVIVGFPGETTEDFEQTLSLAEAVRYHGMFSFKYSPRPATLAFKRMPDDVREGEKTRRIVELQALQKAIQLELHQELVGRAQEVFVDSRSKRRDHELSGRTSGNTVVNIPGSPDLFGRIVTVRIVGAGPNSVRGELMVA